MAVELRNLEKEPEPGCRDSVGGNAFRNLKSRDLKVRTEEMNEFSKSIRTTAIWPLIFKGPEHFYANETSNSFLETSFMQMPFIRFKWNQVGG